jgi:dTDP-4-dehydrorhamnose 3,5-epimerase
MKFRETPLQGAYIIELETFEDKRGYFARTFCRNEFKSRHIPETIVQSNISFNAKKGTIRGMHYQDEPYGEPKIVSCYAGEIYDVIIDLRPDSNTYCRWFGIELSESKRRSLYIPPGFAHGFQTVEDNSLVHYQMGEYYMPGSARGIRWDDPLFNIQWPLDDIVISDKDRSYADFKK